MAANKVNDPGEISQQQPVRQVPQPPGQNEHLFSLGGFALAAVACPIMLLVSFAFAIGSGDCASGPYAAMCNGAVGTMLASVALGGASLTFRGPCPGALGGLGARLVRDLHLAATAVGACFALYWTVKLLSPLPPGAMTGGRNPAAQLGLASGGALFFIGGWKLAHALTDGWVALETFPAEGTGNSGIGPLPGKGKETDRDRRNRR